jgi:CRISPR-associated protein Cmr2
MLDGDNMGKLLMGDPGSIQVTWREVLHPVVPQKIEASQSLQDTGWGTILSAPRLMGPSLHAFISRTLAEFSHRLVPWVVEQDYSGFPRTSQAPRSRGD